MNVRRVVLDVEKALQRPELLTVVEAIDAVAGVEGVNMIVDEIDAEAMGMEIVVEGNEISFEELVSAIEKTGAVVRSLDEIAVGDRLVARRGAAA